MPEVSSLYILNPRLIVWELFIKHMEAFPESSLCFQESICRTNLKNINASLRELWRIFLKTNELIRLVFDSSNDKIWKHGSQNSCQEFPFLFPETFKIWSIFLWGKIKRSNLLKTSQSFCSAIMSYAVYGGYLGPPMWILSLEELYYHNTVTSLLFLSFSFLLPSLPKTNSEL